jgi:hypothetical protein
VAGTITGAGKYASGKKVTLKATANKGYVFAGWSDAGGSQLAATEADAINCVPPAVLNGQDARSASVSFAMPSNDVALVAQFVTADEDKQSIWLAVDGVEMRRVEDNAPYRTNVWCGVYLEWPIEVDALSLPTVKVTGLPSGLKFADKPVTTKVGTGKAAVVVTNVPANTIYGAPTAASKTTTDKKTGAAKPSEVKVTVTTAGKSSQTYQIDTTVDALPAWAQGTFQGAMVATGETPVVPVNGQDARSTSGIASLTVSAAGKVSGKAQGEFAYTLAAPYYSGFEVATEGDVASGGETLVSNFLADVTASWSYKEGSKTVKTNDVVQMTVRDNGVGGVVTGGARPVAPEGADAQERVPPSWTAWQYNWKVEPWKKLGKSFDKKTQVYAILADGTFSDSEEHVRATLGAEVTGRVTLKFAASGAVIVAGEFVTGYNEKTKKYTTVKASGSATLVPLDAERGAVFIYLAPKGLSPHACCLTVSWPEE